MDETELLQSVETAIERTNSAVFKHKDLSPEIRKKLKEDEKERAKHRWAGKGLALDENGRLPQTQSDALKLIIKELVKGAFRGIGLGILLKGGLNFAFGLLQRKKLSDAFKEFFASDTLQFSRFLSAYLGLFRGVNALTTYLKGEDAAENSWYAGAVASVAMLLDEKDRRQGIALYLFVRAVDVIIKKLVRIGTLPYWEHFEALMFGVSNMPIMYGFLYEPEILQKGYYKWILGMGNVTHDGLETTLRVNRNALMTEGKHLPFCNCSVGYHEGPCLQYVLKDWFLGLGRAGRIYLPVHLLPLLVFRYKALLNNPTNTATHTLKAFISSCMFLTTYQSLVKGNCCFWRNRLQRDENFAALLSGLLTGLSTFFERKSRVSELMLYCWPRALEATWVYFEKRGRVKNVKNGEILLFAFASATLMSCLQQDFKPTYHKALCFLIGS